MTPQVYLSMAMALSLLANHSSTGNDHICCMHARNRAMDRLSLVCSSRWIRVVKMITWGMSAAASAQRSAALSSTSVKASQ